MCRHNYKFCTQTYTVRFLVSKIFNYTSCFVNNNSDITYIYHQDFTLVKDTILAKRAYKAELRKYSKEVRYYHTNKRMHTRAKYKAEVKDNK